MSVNTQQPLLSVDQASKMLTTLGSTGREQIANQKLSFCDTGIEWMTSSGTSRTFLSAFSSIGLSKWNCDLSMLPKLADRITATYQNEMPQIKTSQQAQEIENLLAEAITGIGILKACHYNLIPAKAELVENAETSLIGVWGKISQTKEELMLREAPVIAPTIIAAPVPVTLTPIQTLKQRYDSLRIKYLAFKKEVAAAAQASKGVSNFTTQNAFSTTLQQQELKDNIEKELPPEISGNDEFNNLRFQLGTLMRLDALLVIEGQGYGVTRSN